MKKEKLYKDILLKLLKKLKEEIQENADIITDLNRAENINGYLTIADTRMRDMLGDMNMAYILITDFLTSELDGGEYDGVIVKLVRRKNNNKERMN